MALAASSLKPGERTAHYTLLAAAAAARIRDQRIPGSHWVRDDGCSRIVEGFENNVSPRCAKALLWKKSLRYLDFFSVDQRGRIDRSL